MFGHFILVRRIAEHLLSHIEQFPADDGFVFAVIDLAFKDHTPSISGIA